MATSKPVNLSRYSMILLARPTIWVDQKIPIRSWIFRALGRFSPAESNKNNFQKLNLNKLIF